jgi:hypothetical protein
MSCINQHTEFLSENQQEWEDLAMILASSTELERETEAQRN